MRHVILLRGINVGGGHRLPMAQLREVLAGAGLQQVRTVIQSGNVVADSQLHGREPGDDASAGRARRGLTCWAHAPDWCREPDDRFPR